MRLADVPDVRFVNVGAGGGTACDPGIGVLWARPQLEAAVRAGADLAIVAFGTNDVRFLHVTPRDYVACIRALAEVPLLVALVPPILPRAPAGLNHRIRAINVAVRRAFRGEIIDFWSGFRRQGSFDDVVHLNDAAQRRRGIRAVRAVRRYLRRGRRRAHPSP
jgi:hypothetical protein